MIRKGKYLRNEEQIKLFGLRIRTLRKHKGMSIQELADMTDVEYSQISRIERGLINTSLSTLFAIANALETETKDLFDF